VCAELIKGRAGAGVRARAGAESTVMTSACGENGSHIPVPCEISSGSEISTEKEEARS
jgi:hypothetical protein